MASPSEYIEGLVAQNPVVIFSKSTCPYCHMAKEALTEVGAKYVTVELNQVSNGSTIQRELGKMTGRSTVPNVFVGGKTIGGGDDTVALKRSGRLRAIVEEAGGLA